MSTPDQTSRPPQVEIRHVFKRFLHNGSKLTVLQDVSLTIEQGEFVCLLGPSGCGKSTLIQLIAGLDRPDDGHVLVDGNEVTGPGFDRVVVFQDAALFPWLSVLGNVEFGLHMKGLSRPERRARALEHLKLVHLSKFVHAYPHQLSGGMKQRAAIARALVMDPKILLLDEPLGALDAQTRSILQEEILQLWQATRKTIFFVTHNVREATFLADRVFEITARPGTIKNEYPINVPRPRREQDPHLLTIQAKVMGSLKAEIEKVAQEELDTNYRVSKAGILMPVDRNVGSNI